MCSLKWVCVNKFIFSWYVLTEQIKENSAIFKKIVKSIVIMEYQLMMESSMLSLTSSKEVHRGREIIPDQIKGKTSPLLKFYATRIAKQPETSRDDFLCFPSHSLFLLFITHVNAVRFLLSLSLYSLAFDFSLLINWRCYPFNIT